MTNNPVPCQCDGCHESFASRNAVFKHLIATNGACLDPSDYQNFVKYVVKQKKEKVLILYGYIPEYIPETAAKAEANNSNTPRTIMRNGEDAAHLLLQVLADLQTDNDATSSSNAETSTTSTTAATADASSVRLNRSYGNSSRSTDIVAQDEGTAAITEVLTTRLSPLLCVSVEEWMDKVNVALQERLSTLSSSAQLRVFGRILLPSSASKFNAEMDVSRRRIEYLLPADFLYNNKCSGSLEEFFSNFPSFSDGCFSKAEHYYSKRNEKLNMHRPTHETLMYLYSLKSIMKKLTTQIVELDCNDPVALLEKQYSQQKRDRTRKHHSQRSSSNHQKQQESSSREAKSQESSENGTNPDSSTSATLEDQQQQISNKKAKNQKNNKDDDEKKKEKKHVLRRRRFHNFTPTVMAHEFLAFRRLDRFYHRSTLRFNVVADDSTSSSTGRRTVKLLCDEDHESTKNTRAFMALSLSGDIFLTGQVCRLVGLFLALARGVVDAELIDCVFDEAYPHLVPMPPAPLFAMYAGEAYYVKWEGKLQSILTPRVSDHYSEGWNDDATLSRIEEWQTTVREHTANAWLRDGVDSDGRLVAEKKWTEEVLEPWAVRARAQLADYKLWKASLAETSTTGITSATTKQGTTTTTVVDSPANCSEVVPTTTNLPPLESVDPAVPPLFEMVLSCLRQIDQGGLWPSTTPKRQLVMISTLNEKHESQGDPVTGTFATSLSVAHMRSKNKRESKSSPYIFEQGQGGASGSFSVGAMPGEKCIQPKNNTTFPELMKAAFELEIALFPDREPSATIAINRNAQFRPHTDSGAGAGQSTSAIVGLGTYSGGDLVVEGKLVDIRYKGIEFNGWTQRHWTMPFCGERYSLVWFTPKGCEGVRGIDLCE